MRRLLAILVAAAAAVAVAAPSAHALPPKVPPSFVGAVADGALMEGTVDLPAELDQMVGSGVQSVRVMVDWAEAQPYRRSADVPPEQMSRFKHVENGIPTDYGPIDMLVAGAVQRRMTLLPIIMKAPAWNARHPGNFNSPPKGTDHYSRFAAALVRRYGPNGKFWTERPELPKRPVRHWQFWNEPSLEFFWADQPWQKDYVALLRAARRRVLGVDSGATIVLAGLPNRSWPDLESIYKLKARGLFDVVAIHPFTAQVSGVLKILRLNREVMRKYGDRKKPLMVSELSWTSARKKTEWTYGNETTEPGQAKKLSQAFELLAEHRRELRLQRVYWYTWLTRDAHPQYPFDYAGLSRLEADGTITRKPAFDAFRKTALMLERCKTKSGTADRCAS